MINRTPTPEHIWRLCLSCARHVHGHRPPSEAYALRVAHILFATAAHESTGFTERRQRRFDFNDRAGGWGIFQVQSATLRTCIRRLEANPVMRRNAAQWLYGHPEAPEDWYLAFTDNHGLGMEALLRVTAISDAVAALWARLTYMGDPDPIPSGLVDMARCWGKVYNTRQEDEKNRQWIQAYREHLPDSVQPVEE